MRTLWNIASLIGSTGGMTGPHPQTRARKAANRIIADAFADDLRRQHLSVLLLDEHSTHYRVYTAACAIDFWGGTHRFRSLNGDVKGIGLENLSAVIGGGAVARQASIQGAA